MASSSSSLSLSEVPGSIFLQLPGAILPQVPTVVPQVQAVIPQVPGAIFIQVIRICRTCLSEKDLCHVNEAGPGKTSLVSEVLEFFKVQMNGDDGKSNMLCKKCIDRLIDWSQQLKNATTCQAVINFLATKTPPNISQPDHSEVLQTSSSMEYESTNAIVLSKTSKYKSHKRLDCPFCNAYYFPDIKLQLDVKFSLCAKHIKPFTCLQVDCNLVFPNKEVFIKHYRFHLGLLKNNYLCHQCYDILKCPRKLIKEEHTHQDITKYFKCCSQNFPAMSDFALHKLQNHNARIVASVFKVNNYKRRSSMNSVASLGTDMAIFNLPFENVQLFTCLVPNCDKVYSVDINNSDHFRSHANIHNDFFICNICLRFSMEKDDIIDCDHRNPQIICEHCKMGFQSLQDLAKHKIVKHNVVFLCGMSNIPVCPVCRAIFNSDEDPKDHYLKCFNRNHVKPMVKTEKQEASLVLSRRGGELFEEDKQTGMHCNTCDIYCSNLTEYVSHLNSMHGNHLKLKETGIKICPMCSKNYLIKNYVEHIEQCCRTMEIGHQSNRFGCIHCFNIFDGLSTCQFRKHLMFCKSFRRVVDNNGTKYYRCMYCTYKSKDHVACIGHANTSCIYFQLMMKYAMKAEEKKEVEERVVFEMDDTLDHDQSSSKTSCDLSRQKLLGIYDYMCNNCGKRFFDQNTFQNHLKDVGIRCRSNKLRYCNLCVSDFDSVEKYYSHNPDITKSLPIQYNTLFGIKTEPEPYYDMPYEVTQYEVIDEDTKYFDQVDNENMKDTDVNSSIPLQGTNVTIYNGNMQLPNSVYCNVDSMTFQESVVSIDENSMQFEEHTSVGMECVIEEKKDVQMGEQVLSSH